MWGVVREYVLSHGPRHAHLRNTQAWLQRVGLELGRKEGRKAGARSGAAGVARDFRDAAAAASRPAALDQTRKDNRIQALTQPRPAGRTRRAADRRCATSASEESRTATAEVNESGSD